MKITTFFLALCLCAQSFAATTSSTLSEILDQHHYFLTVEWDQKDTSHLNQQNEIFVSTLSKKLSDGEISEEEINTYIAQSMSPEAMTSMKKKINQAIASGNHQDMTSLLKEVSSQSHAQGASWNALTTGLVVTGGIALTLFVAYTWFIHKQLECDGFYDCHGGE